VKISNFDKLAENDLRKTGLLIAEAGLAAIDTEEAIKRSVVLENNELTVKGIKIPTDGFNRIFTIAVGKCAIVAAASLKKIFGDKLTGGFAYDIKPGEIPGIEVLVGDHPFPSEKNAENSKRILKFLDGLRENDLVIFVVSGGGSALLSNPEDFSVEKEKEIMKKLFRDGAGIKEINTIRKHISLNRGGNLAKAAYPAKVISLIFSDVPGDNIEFVASGPTVKDTTTVADAEEVFKKYQIRSECGIVEGGLMETPKEDKYFANVLNLLVVSNNVALEAMAEEAERLGFGATIVTDVLDGEARFAGEMIVEALHEESPKKVLLYGGETVVVVKGNGKGGRNQELCLSGLRFIKEDELVLTLASDGRDNTEAAGAICDIISKRHAAELGVDPAEFLEKNDSYGFFEKTGDHLLTGPTGSNVADLIIAIKQ
jgi:glycerate-2-kinase